MRPLIPTFSTYLNDLYIEAAPTGKTHCKVCHAKIGQGEARITFHRSMASSHFFHLYCFTPITHVRMSLEKGMKVVGTEIQEEVEEWMGEWNRQFDYKDGGYLEKRVKTKPPKLRRVLLESFKYLDIRTIANTTARVCKDWYHISWEDELWHPLALSSFPSLGSTSDYRKAYLLQYFTSCAHCNQPLSNPLRHAVCPLTSRPKCIRCYSDQKNRPQRLLWAKQLFGITPGHIRQLGLRKFQFDGHECIYLYQCLDQVMKHRKQLADDILARENDELDALFSKALFDAIRVLDEADFETVRTLCRKCGGQNVGNNQRELIQFFISGKNISSFEKLVAKIKPDL